MNKPYWTVGKLRDAIERLALLHQHSVIDSVRILHQHQWLVITLRQSATSEPEEITLDPYGVVHPEKAVVA